MMMELSLAKRRAPLSSNKPSMLKDFLLDDLSSCSSNGFRAYPRRQCCTTVRFLLEIDMKNKPTTKQRKKKINYNKPQQQTQQPLGRSPLKPTGAPISAFQRASEAIIKAVKHLPFPSFKSSTKYSSSSPSKLKLGILPRSLSRKFLSKRFWKKNNHKEIQMWGPIINHLADDYEEEEENSSPPRDFTVSVSAAAVVGGGGVSSNSSTSESSTTTNSWSDSDFTNSDESLQSSTANSSTTKIPEESNKKVLPIDGVVSNGSSKRVGVIVGGADDSTVVNQSSSSNSSSTNSNSPPNTSKKSWPNEEKEQFSPVSVLDYPFEDDEEDEVSSSSPFQNRLARVEGTKKRLMKKIMRFELLTELEPVNLVKRIAVSSESDQESIQDQFSYHIEETTTTAAALAEEKASEFLDILKYTMSPPYNNNIKPYTEKLLLDFFKLGHLESEKMEELVAIAKDWVIGKNTNNEQVLDWKVKKNREMYIREMEKSGEWRRRNKEKQEVGLEMEVEIFASLISELLDDLLL